MFPRIALPTVAEAIAEGARLLRDSSVDEDRRTASLLLRHLLGIDQAELIVASAEPLDPEAYKSYLALIRRRAAGEPVQYITGHQEFYGLDFVVTPDVLIPRPETEFLVERVIALASKYEMTGTGRGGSDPAQDIYASGPPQADDISAPDSRGNRKGILIADVGTGSGCIAVALAANLPEARVIATDISPAALEVAASNARRHKVTDRVELAKGDLLAPLSGLEGAVDFVVSNPPYVPTELPELLQREVRDFEPPVALFGGSDGLDFYRRLLVASRSYLKTGGYLVCEIGYSQLSCITEMLDQSVWEMVDITNDLQGIPRALAVRATAKRLRF